MWWEVVWFGDRLFLGRRSIMIQNRKLDISEFRWAHLSRLDNKIVIWKQSHTTRKLRHPEFLQTFLQLRSEAMLWIWQLSHLRDSEARRYILGSKARHVVTHFLLVLPETGFALKSSTAIHHRRNES